MEYFNIKYVNDGMYFRVKSDNPPIPPAPSYLNAYFSSNGADDTDVDIGRNTNYDLYDSDGNYIIGDESKIYSIVGIYKSDGTRITNDGRDYVWVLAGKLLLYSYPIDGHHYLAYRLEYTEVQTLTAWFKPDKSPVIFGAGETKVLYDDDGEKITYNDAAVYTIYMWRTSSEWTYRYVDYYKLVNLDGFLACINTNDTGYAGCRGLRFYSQHAELS